MQDFMITLLVNVGTVSAIVLLFKIFKLVEIDLRWCIVSLVLISANFSALFLGKHIIPLELLFSDLDRNWGGKIASIVLWGLVLLALSKFKQDFQPAYAGFTLKQNAGSVKPTVIATLGLVAFQIGFISIFGNSPDYDAEELLFQATMPGLDEEPWFRGIVLYTLSLAIVSRRFNVLGANLNVAGLSLVILFGLIHGFYYNEGSFTFSLFSVCITGFYGVVLLWLRERTGSLLFPLLAHNSVNFFGQFFPLSF